MASELESGFCYTWTAEIKEKRFDNGSTRPGTAEVKGSIGSINGRLRRVMLAGRNYTWTTEINGSTKEGWSEKNLTGMQRDAQEGIKCRL